jgi:hypothetical protein
MLKFLMNELLKFINAVYGYHLRFGWWLRIRRDHELLCSMPHRHMGIVPVVFRMLTDLRCEFLQTHHAALNMAYICRGGHLSGTGATIKAYNHVWSV